MITACILTKNSERSISDTLASLSFLPEVIVLDTGSTDRTLICAKKFPNVSIHECPFLGFGKMRNYAAELAHNDWILAIDSDEIITTPLTKELETLTLNPDQIYEFPFHNYFNNRWIKGCGWHPEYHIRLYNRKKTQFSSDLVHEKLTTQSMKVHRLKNPIHHIPYRTTADFLLKMQFYSDLYANQNRKKKRSSLFVALVHAMFTFFKSYFLKRGCFLGKEGAIIAIYQANVAFYKYLKLDEVNRQ